MSGSTDTTDVPTTVFPPTRIERDADQITSINFLHVNEADQESLVDITVRIARAMRDAPGIVDMNVLRSLDGGRIATYGQWDSLSHMRSTNTSGEVPALQAVARTMLLNEARPRDYSVVYTDDRGPDRVSVISPSYRGAIFINEITTHPATQARLLELVIANNEIQSQHTPGYRSANFHRSSDGQRAVNYSQWDSAEHCIEAISAMADMDENLAETVEIANPDFRFYTLVDAWHR